MSLYESNYLRFLRLAGDPAQLSGTLISRVAGDCELQLSVIEHMRYTSTLALTYLLPQAVPAGAPRAAAGSEAARLSRCAPARGRGVHSRNIMRGPEAAGPL